MYIGFLTRWNAACATSILAELIGREWVKMGHKLRVYAPLNDPRLVQNLDEDYVSRCYTMVSKDWRKTESIFYENEILKDEHDIFIVQKVDFIIATNELFNTLKKLKERGTKIVYIVHERKMPFADEGLFEKFIGFEWDALVCFDKRYEKFLLEYFPKNKIHMIPFPCHPIIFKNHEEVREKLNLPTKSKIILSFGWRITEILETIPILDQVNKTHDFTYIVLTNPEHYDDWQIKVLYEFTKKNCKSSEPLNPSKCLKLIENTYNFIKFIYDSPSIEKLYDYLIASDLLLVHKNETPPDEVVISSTVIFALGSLTPIITSDTKFVETLEDEVIKYKSLQELKEKLTKALEDEEFVRKVKERAFDYAMKNSADVIARKYIQLFEELLGAKITEYLS